MDAWLIVSRLNYRYDNYVNHRKDVFYCPSITIQV